MSLFIERLGLSAWTAIFSVNFAGCFLAGLIAALLSRYGLLKENYHALIMTGFLGGFTTYSAFAIETMVLWHKSKTTALTYAGIQTALCLTAVFVGHRLGQG